MGQLQETSYEENSRVWTKAVKQAAAAVDISPWTELTWIGCYMYWPD